MSTRPHLRRAPVPIAWARATHSGLSALVVAGKRHMYDGTTYDEYVQGDQPQPKTLCGRKIPKVALPGAGHPGTMATVFRVYPDELSRLDACKRCAAIDERVRTANLTADGRPIDGGA